MKKLLLLLAVIAVAVVGVRELQGATAYRGGAGATGARTVVTFDVTTKNYHHSDDVAAAALWQICVGTIGWDDATPPAAIGGGEYRASVRPSLAADANRRLRGCLEDSTVDRVQGHIDSAVDVS